MELILISILGIASLIVLEFCGLVYERWVSEPHPIGSEFYAAPLVNQPGPLTLSHLLSCSEAPNDAYTTTIVRVRSRRTGTNRQEYDHA